MLIPWAVVPLWWPPPGLAARGPGPRVRAQWRRPVPPRSASPRPRAPAPLRSPRRACRSPRAHLLARANKICTSEFLAGTSAANRVTQSPLPESCHAAITPHSSALHAHTVRCANSEIEVRGRCRGSRARRRADAGTTRSPDFVKQYSPLTLRLRLSGMSELLAARLVREEESAITPAPGCHCQHVAGIAQVCTQDLLKPQTTRLHFQNR